MHKCRFSIPIYFGNLYFMITDSPKEDLKSQFKIELDDYNFGGICFDRNQGHDFLICIRKESLSLGTLTHEVKHFVNMLFSYRGIELDPDNDEAECYFLTYIMDKIQQKLISWNYLTFN